MFLSLKPSDGIQFKKTQTYSIFDAAATKMGCHVYVEITIIEKT